jgi:hypothetical protein
MSAVSDSDDETDAGQRGPFYAYKPSLLGAPYEFMLGSDALFWRMGSHSGRVGYDRVTRVRMSFRPSTMQSQRFLTEIWSAGNPKLRIYSASWRSVLGQERLDAAYAGFVTELHRRLAAAGTTALFRAGMPLLPYWIGAVVFSAVMVAMTVMTVQALQSGQWTGAAIIGLFFLVFAVQVGMYFRRNWPSRYRPDALPAYILPRRRNG